MAKRNGRSRERGERFAKIPLGVLEHPACSTLPLAAFKVLVVLAAGYSGSNNGTLACTESWGKKFGIGGTDTVWRSLRELTARGLVEVTRQGMKMRKMPTLYALTWQPVNNRDGQPIDIPQLPSHRYLKWVETEFHPSQRGTVTPVRGVEGARFTPLDAVTQPVFTPTRGDTLRIYTGGLEQQRAKVLKLMRQLPHLGDGDIAKIVGAPHELVASVRQQQ